MENGSYQSYMQKSNPDMRVGDHVQVNHGVVRQYYKPSQNIVATSNRR